MTSCPGGDAGKRGMWLGAVFVEDTPIIVVKTAPRMLKKLTHERYDRSSSRRGRVRTNDSNKPKNENTIVHVECPVNTFIMIENVMI